MINAQSLASQVIPPEWLSAARQRSIKSLAIVFFAAQPISGAASNAIPAEPSSAAYGNCSPNRVMTVTQIQACHVEAVGGATALDAIENVRIGVDVIEPAFTVRGDYRATRDMRMRVDISADGKRVFSEGIDRNGGWQQSGPNAEIQSLSEDGHDALIRGIEFNVFGMNDIESRGHSVSLIGSELVEDAEYYVVNLVMSDGFERHLYINRATWMIDRVRETSALHPDLDSEQRPAEVIQGGFFEKCGTIHPAWTRKIDLKTGQEIQRTRVTSFTCNTPPAELEIARGDLRREGHARSAMARKRAPTIDP